MSPKRSKMPLSCSVRRIRKGHKHLRAMSQSDRIDLMVAAGVMTSQQADRANGKLAELGQDDLPPLRN